MIQLPGFKNIQLLQEGPSVLAYRADSEERQRSVILKVLRNEFPSADEIARYEREYKILKQDLGSGVPLATALLTLGRTRVMVLEDIGGVSLREYLRQGQRSVGEKLDLAIEIVRVLDQIHVKELIHCDLKPDNIIYNRETKRLQVIDFGLAVEKQEAASQPIQFKGTLQYMAPEQTGRTQQSLDPRADFYTLGVTLYEMFAGQLPFQAQDHLGWVHAHLALSETPLSELIRDLPPMLSQIVRKLMQKSPEDRYNSAFGLLHDLEKSREAFRNNQFDLSFPLAEKDVSMDFRLSSKLYGRDKEVAVFEEILKAVQQGGRHLVMIEGDPGVGKTSLVREVEKRVSLAGGRFASGKYDQFRQDVPFSSIIQVFNQVLSQILAESEDKVQGWRDRIQQMIGENASLISDLVPRLEILVGKQPQNAGLAGSELRQRFHTTFYNLLSALCDRGRPLVLFFDDLQWADSASRDLLMTFLAEDQCQSLLIIGAIRANEVDEAHPLRTFLRDLARQGVVPQRIELHDLNPEEVESYVLDSFRCSKDDAYLLARLVHQKTKGNPFFAGQFLKNLVDKKIIHYRPGHGCTWKISEIQSQEMTSNVVTLLTQKIESLGLATQQLLQLAACFGIRFRVEELKLHVDISPEEIVSHLSSAVQSGLLQIVERHSYRFVHDRVQESAYSTLTKDQKIQAHWKIAQVLLKKWTPAQLKEGVFYLVNHWNTGCELATDSEQKLKGVELNLLASKRAKGSSVSDLSLVFANRGLELLKGQDLKQNLDSLAELYTLKAEAEYALSQFEQSEESFRTLLKHVKRPLERARIYHNMTELAHMKLRYSEAVHWGTLGLAELGYRLPKNPGQLRLTLMLLSTISLYRKRRDTIPRENADVKNWKAHEITQLIIAISEATYFVNRNQAVYVALAGLRFTLLQEMIELTGRSFLAAIYWNRFGNYKAANEIVDYNLKYSSHFPQSARVGRSLYVTGGLSAHATKGLKPAIRIMEKAFELLMKGGDLVYAGFSALYLGNCHVLSDPHLDQALGEVDRYLKVLKKTKDSMIHDCLVAIQLFAKCLAGQTQAPDSFSTETENENDYVTRIHTHETKNPLGWYAAHKMAALYLMGYPEKCVDHLEGTFRLKDSSSFSPAAVMSNVFLGLVITENMKKFRGLEKLKRGLQLRKLRKTLKKHAEAQPVLYGAHSLIVEAMVHHQAGNFEAALKTAEKAIEVARNGESTIILGLALEVGARLGFLRGFDRMGLNFMREALHVWDTWGALGKVQRILQMHPELAVTRPMAATMSASSGESVAAALAGLDLNTVLRATNTLVSEINMNELIRKLLIILLENAGADRAVLLLQENGQLMIRGDLHSKRKENFELRQTHFEESQTLTQSVVSYVARTRETLMIADATQNERSRHDAYVQSVKLGSLLCLPILSKGELKGLIYLENQNAKGVFTEERLELIRIIAGQAAISIENANLYKEQATNVRRQAELETARAVQETLFPANHADFDSVMIAGHYSPASECSGDWWSYSDMGDELFVWIGDVTGHGAPAALITSAACSAVSVMESNPHLTPANALEVLNKSVYRTNKGQLFMSFFVGRLNKKTGVFRYAKASHDPPFILTKKIMQSEIPARKFMQSVDLIESPNGPLLGNPHSEPFQEGEITLEPGDMILLYTDGLTELTNKENEVWGRKGLLAAAREGYQIDPSPSSIVASIRRKAEEFANQTTLKDDITLCVVEYKGVKAAQKSAA